MAWAKSHHSGYYKRRMLKSPMPRDERGLTPAQATIVSLVGFGMSLREAARELGIRRPALIGWLRSERFRHALAEKRFEAAEFLDNIRKELGVKGYLLLMKLFGNVTDQRLQLELIRTAFKASGVDAPTQHKHEHTVEMTPARARAIVAQAEIEIANKWLKEGKISDTQFEQLRGEKESMEVVDPGRSEIPSGEGMLEEGRPPDEPGEIPAASEPEAPD